jgi:hypothetical protein
MGNPILADILSFIPILQPMALAQETPTSPRLNPRWRQRRRLLVF